MYFLPHTVGENYIQDEKHKELYRAWAEFTPYIFSVDKLQLTNNGGIKSVYHGRAIEESVASKLNIPVDSPVEHYKARRCVEYYFESDHIKHSNPLSNDGIGSALQLIEEKDLTLNGDIFMRMFSISVENEISHLRGIIYLPVD